MIKAFFTLLLFTYLPFADAQQTYLVRDIKSFGAKGNGRTNDHDAFQRAAAFFNARGGQGKLVISKGTYLVGKQVFNRTQPTEPVFEGSDLLYFRNVKNLDIEGQNGSVVKYIKGLRYGAFKPVTGEPYKHGTQNFVLRGYLASIGNSITLNNCTSVKIINLEMDGNNGGHIIGDT